MQHGTHDREVDVWHIQPTVGLLGYGVLGWARVHSVVCSNHKEDHTSPLKT